MIYKTVSSQLIQSVNQNQINNDKNNKSIQEICGNVSFNNNIMGNINNTVNGNNNNMKNNMNNNINNVNDYNMNKYTLVIPFHNHERYHQLPEPNNINNINIRHKQKIN